MKVSTKSLTIAPLQQQQQLLLLLLLLLMYVIDRFEATYAITEN